MSRILLLHQKDNPGKSNYHPKKFEGIIDCNIFINDRSLKMFENQLIDTINEYNPKLNIREIKYLNIKSVYPNFGFKAGIHSGLIVREIEYKDNIIITDEVYIIDRNGQKYVWIIDGYVFTTLVSDKDSRDAFLTQLIFPDFIVYTGKFLESPMYSFLNHPTYIINICNKNITARSVFGQMAAVTILGFHHIHIFPYNKNVTNRDYTINEYMNEFIVDYKANQFYSGEFFDLDESNKYIKFKDPSTYLLNQAGQFHGSREKFYFFEILPLFVMAIKEKYEIDYREIESFNSSNAHTNKVSSKFIYFQILLNYMKKLNGVK